MLTESTVNIKKSVYLLLIILCCSSTLLINTMVITCYFIKLSSPSLPIAHKANDHFFKLPNTAITIVEMPIKSRMGKERIAEFGTNAGELWR